MLCLKAYSIKGKRLQFVTCSVQRLPVEDRIDKGIPSLISFVLRIGPKGSLLFDDIHPASEEMLIRVFNDQFVLLLQKGGLVQIVISRYNQIRGVTVFKEKVSMRDEVLRSDVVIVPVVFA